MSVSSPQPPQLQQSQQQYYSQQNQQQPPALPPKIPNTYASGNSNNESTANILDDLKALQDEVDKIRNLTGGFFERCMLVLIKYTLYVIEFIILQ